MVTLANVVGVAVPSLLWAHAINLLPLPLHAVLGLIAAWGFAWAFAFYIPPGLLALQIGGPDHSALITNVADGAGFTVAALFSILAMSRGRSGAWGSVMQTLSAFSFLALIALRHAMGASR